ncbi:hypothetical protein BKA61DRAFT_74806 [Leptodontidium sp. MPI-SDFR-AT-0119]|nr:hypothetical protein BKA61DRAFT_74806 [Leptodontidium sp. MPI-SDFR-AT-0119]
MRHGSSFALANRGVLEVMGMVRSGRQQTSSPFNQGTQHARPTTLHITFVAPRPFSADLQKKSSQNKCASQIATAAEIILASSIGILMGLKHIYVGSILMACIVLNTLVLLLFRLLLKPVFANEQAMARDAQVGCSGGAALDVHLIAPTWNASQINVICGYSSQVHSLTNLPILITSSSLVKWCCRALALNLIIQAAALTSQVNSHSIQVWGSITWMLFYLIMLAPSCIMKRLYSGTILEDNSYFIRKLPPLQFSRRRSALAFLAMLPVNWSTYR